VTGRPRVAVVGHVEWATHALGAFPGPGEIRSLDDPFDEPAGGGAVAALQAAKAKGYETDQEKAKHAAEAVDAFQESLPEHHD